MRREKHEVVIIYNDRQQKNKVVLHQSCHSSEFILIVYFSRQTLTDCYRWSTSLNCPCSSIEFLKNLSSNVKSAKNAKINNPVTRLRAINNP